MQIQKKGNFMKKKILLSILTFTILSSVLTGCGNKDMWDTQYTFNYVNITLQTGEVVSGEVQSWTDYEDGEQLQIKVNDTVYLVHSSNVDLMYVKE